MTYVMRSWVLFSCLLGLSVTGCGFDGLGEGIGMGVACAFHFDFTHRVDSDGELVRAKVQCAEGADCADRSTVAKGATFELVIEVPESATSSQPTITSDTERLEITGFDTERDPCDGNYELHGTVHYKDVGPAALIVSDIVGEIDRFSVTVHEPTRLDVQVLEGLDPFRSREGYTSYGPGDMLSIDTVHTMRVFARNEAGERLVGATGFSWEVDDSSIAEVSNEREATLTPLAIGSTTLRAHGAGLTAELELEVAGVREWTPDEDAGTTEVAP